MGHNNPRRFKNHQSHRGQSRRTHQSQREENPREDDSLPPDQAPEEEPNVPKIHLAMWWGRGNCKLVVRELLKAYSECENSAVIISVQNSWLSQQSQILKVLSDAEDNSEDEGSSNDSEDGLPPPERNMNHLSLQESDGENE